jgi:hypothetical protein
VTMWVERLWRAAVLFRRHNHVHASSPRKACLQADRREFSRKAPGCLFQPRRDRPVETARLGQFTVVVADGWGTICARSLRLTDVDNGRRDIPYRGRISRTTAGSEFSAANANPCSMFAGLVSNRVAAPYVARGRVLSAHSFRTRSDVRGATGTPDSTASCRATRPIGCHAP